MGLFLSNISDNIKETLSKRQINNAQNRGVNGWFNRKTPWVRLTSMAAIDGNSEIRKDWKLFAGTTKSDNKYPSGYQGLYNTSNRPLPGITNVSVNNKGSMGSTREATITFVCWDIKQLNILEKLYMTPGISLLLEWGWSIDLDNNNITDDLSLEPPQWDICITKKIVKRMEETKGHYDGMQGPVSSFNWSLRTDGGFDCSTTIVTMASMFLDMDTHSSSKNIRKSTVDTKIKDDENPNAPEENIIATISTLRTMMDESEELRLGEKILGFKKELKATIESSDSEDEEALDWNEDTHYFIKWEFLEKIIINSNVAFEVQESNTVCGEQDENTTETTETISFKFVGQTYTFNKKTVVPELNSDNILINIEDWIVSSDPTKVLLPLNNEGETLIEIPSDLLSTVDSDSLFPIKDLLVNLRYVYDTYKKTNTLIDFIKELLNGISNACGGYWDFDVIVDERSPTQMIVVDYNTINNKNTIQPFIFKVNDVNSVVKGCDLSTEVSEKIKSMIMLGTNRGMEPTQVSFENVKETLEQHAPEWLQKQLAPAISAINQSAGRESSAEYNFFGSVVTNLSSKTLAPQQASMFDTLQSAVEAAERPTEQDYINDIVKGKDLVYNATWLWDDGASNENTEKLRLAVNRYITNVLRPTGDYGKISKHKEVPILPLKLSLTIDGISGVKFGNAMSIDYLPDRYLNASYFQVTNVSHTIGTDTWETQFETIMRVDMNKIVVVDESKTTPSKNTYPTKDMSNEFKNNTKVEEEVFVEPEDLKYDKLLIMLDAGHAEGDYKGDKGWKRYPTDGVNSIVPQLQEWDFNRKVMKKIHNKLKALGFFVIPLVTDEKDKQFLNKPGIGYSTGARARQCNAIKKQYPDYVHILLSIHGNAMPTNKESNFKVGGPCVYIKGQIGEDGLTNPYYNLSKSFAAQLANKLIKVFDFPGANTLPKFVYTDSGFKIPLLQRVDMIALLSENGFYTSDINRKFMLTDNGQEQIANAHVEFIQSMNTQISKK